MINNTPSKPIRKLESVANTVYAAKEGWSYSHHAFISYFKDKFYAIWSNGKVNEDDCGQRVMLAESKDGEHWVNQRPVVTPKMRGNPKLVLMAAGFFIDGDVLRVYYGYYHYKESFLNEDGSRKEGDVCHEDTGMGYVATTDGENWSEPQDMNIPMIPNHGPQKTASGRIIITGSVIYPYTDRPDGVSGYQMTGIYGDAFQERPLCDDSESIHHVTQFNGWDTKLICEGSFFQRDNGVLYMMLRSNSDYLWCAESHDDGATWSAPYKTEYTDCGSKFHFGRLPDGRYYGVSNPVKKSERNPLSICLSKDGENFDECYILRDEPYVMQFEGMYKGGLYGYPHTLIHDGYLYIIYSKRKESVEVTKLALEQLKEERVV